MWAGCTLARHDISSTSILPWRQHRTPYRIFLAEMLLIRTRTDIVAHIFEKVFKQFPDIYVLAHAKEEDLQRELHSIGLPKRVPYIIKAAKFICEKHGGGIPHQVEDLLKVPGIGQYSATAIAAFAYGQPLVPSDVNILRFVSRLTGVEMENKTKGSRYLQEITSFLSESKTALSAEQLLDFSRLICRPRDPLCEQCPLTKGCKFFLGGAH